MKYVGDELETFLHARNWKQYLRALVTPYLHGEVLEVGAGIGATTRAFRDLASGRWTCLEPDPQLASRLSNAAEDLDVRVCIGTLADVPAAYRFDCILYIDVLEHIVDDRAELLAAASRLHRGGRLVVMSPAHQWLFTAFDRRIGHVRRYSARSLRALTPPGTRLTSRRHLDSAGFLLSLGNRLLLRSSMPSVRQVELWDGVFVPISQKVDRLLNWRMGKSILAVWTRE